MMMMMMMMAMFVLSSKIINTEIMLLDSVYIGLRHIYIDLLKTRSTLNNKKEYYILLLFRLTEVDRLKIYFKDTSRRKIHFLSR